MLLRNGLFKVAFSRPKLYAQVNVEESSRVFGACILVYYMLKRQWFASNSFQFPGLSTTLEVGTNEINLLFSLVLYWELYVVGDLPNPVTRRSVSTRGPALP